MKSPQNGEIKHVRLQYLSIPSNQPLSRTKLTRGADLFFDFQGKSYPVQFLGYEGIYVFSIFVSLWNNIYDIVFRYTLYSHLRVFCLLPTPILEIEFLSCKLFSYDLENQNSRGRKLEKTDYSSDEEIAAPLPTIAGNEELVCTEWCVEQKKWPKWFDCSIWFVCEPINSWCLVSLRYSQVEICF